MATTPESLWEVRRIPNKGYGVVATAPIEPGACLLMEKPLYIRPMTDDPIQQQNSIVESLIRSLPDAAQRDAFHALASSFSVLYPDYPYYSIATTNEVALSGAQDGASGLFLRWSRFNHACTPSAYWAWNDNDGTSSSKGRRGVLTVHAIRRLNPGDEISICYFENRVMPHDDRERYLAEVYCFACDCALCSLAPGPWRDDVDERLRQLEAFWRKYHLGEETQGPPSSPSSPSSLSTPASSAATPTIATTLKPSNKDGNIASKEEEGDKSIIDVRALNQQRYLQDAAGCLAECRKAAELILEAEEDIALALALFVGDAARASVFAARNRDRYTVTLGADSAEALRAGRCAENPCADRSFGLGGDGRRVMMGSDVVPNAEEIGEEAFEEWLWSAEEWQLRE
ncbi:SET domain-containing protein [Apiospora sp. TS-2023a]